jgi:hypothetical protein
MIKAIETYYKGYRFRSRLEARWAVFFDAMGLRWEYEPQGFNLPDCSPEYNDNVKWTKYLPDFLLPDLQCWCEVKGNITMDNVRLLCDASVIDWGLPDVRKDTNGPALLLLGKIPEFGQVPAGIMFNWHKGSVLTSLYGFENPHKDLKNFYNMYYFNGCSWENTIYGDSCDFYKKVAKKVIDFIDMSHFWETTLNAKFYKGAWPEEALNYKAIYAANLARQARFEHGECGAPA